MVHTAARLRRRACKVTVIEGLIVVIPAGCGSVNGKTIMTIDIHPFAAVQVKIAATRYVVKAGYGSNGSHWYVIQVHPGVISHPCP